tara:strand:+ start:13952 stop:14620 length:669 start_codon:yes stop_codon:yes gene_type:complete
MKFISARQAIYAAYAIHLGSTSSMEPQIHGSKQNNIGKLLNAFEAGHIISVVEKLPQAQRELLMVLYGPMLFTGRCAHARIVNLLSNYVGTKLPRFTEGTITEAHRYRLWALMDCVLKNYQSEALRSQKMFTKPLHFCAEVDRLYDLKIEANHFSRTWDDAINAGTECIDKIERIALPKVAKAVVKVWHLQSDFIDTDVLSDDQATHYLTHNEVKQAGGVAA